MEHSKKKMMMILMMYKIIVLHYNFSKKTVKLQRYLKVEEK